MRRVWCALFGGLSIFNCVCVCAGNKEEEETMMQEWFSLLNGKNELIKRQIELNLM